MLATCSECGLTKGELSCHDWSPKGCTVCGESFEDEFACHTLKDWELNTEETEYMTADCLTCGKMFSVETEWSYFADDFIPGLWALDLM